MSSYSLVIQYIALGLLLLLSFYFSGTETAVFSLSRLERDSLRKNRSKLVKRILPVILDHPDQLLITILTGNMIVNIFASGVGEMIGARLFNAQGELFSIIVMTLMLLVFGELTPKRIAVSYSRTFTLFSALPLHYLHILLSPARRFFSWITGLLFGKIPGDLGQSLEHKHALVLSTAELGYQRQILKQSEYRLFKSYITFKEKTAQSVMVPRSELRTVAHDMTVGGLLEQVEQDPDCIINASVLLYREDNDHLYGWIPVSALLECKFSTDGLNLAVSSLARPFHTVPDSKDLPTLISELRKSDMEIVLLVDEYGGTAGVVWFRNIIEDVLKAFYAPYREQIDQSDSGLLQIPASMPLAEFAEMLGVKLSNDAETAAGLFLDLYGEIPRVGDRVILGDSEIIVHGVDGNKITVLAISKRTQG